MGYSKSVCNVLCTMKVQLSPIIKCVHAAALLSYIHTFLEANQNAAHFDCIPPTSDEYVDVHANILHIYKYGLICIFIYRIYVYI